MALLLMEGFDDGLASTRNVVANGTIDAAYGRSGKGMLVGDATNTYVRNDVNALSSDMTITVGCDVNIQSIGGGYVMWNWDVSASYWDVIVRFDSANNRFYVTDKTGSTYAANNTAYLDTWYYLEFQWLSSDTVGTIELRQDGATVASATGRDTRYVASQRKTRFDIGGTQSVDVDAMWVDNLYYLDSTGTSNNDFLGICEVQTILPSGNGTTNTMTGSDENQVDNYLLVDNNASAPPVTTEYVESATEGHKDTYAMGDLTGTPTVYGVAAAAYAQKDASGAKFLRNVVRSGTTDYAGTSLALSDNTYSLVEETWDQDPDTSTAWTASGVNAMEAGQEVRDS
jgi:hypothetical protein